MRPIALVTTFLLFAACATAGESAATGPVATATPAKTQAGEPKKVKVICTNEKSLGSNFSERVCRRVTDSDDQREATQIELLRPRAAQQRPGG